MLEKRDDVVDEAIDVIGAKSPEGDSITVSTVIEEDLADESGATRQRTGEVRGDS